MLTWLIQVLTISKIPKESLSLYSQNYLQPSQVFSTHWKISRIFPSESQLISFFIHLKVDIYNFILANFFFDIVIISNQRSSFCYLCHVPLCICLSKPSHDLATPFMGIEVRIGTNSSFCLRYSVYTSCTHTCMYDSVHASYHGS